MIPTENRIIQFDTFIVKYKYKLEKYTGSSCNFWLKAAGEGADLLCGQELAPLQHLVAPGVQEPVGRPLPPRLLLPGHGEGPAPGRLHRSNNSHTVKNMKKVL